MTWTYKSMACPHSVWMHEPHTSAWLAGFPTIYTSAQGLHTHTHTHTQVVLILKIIVYWLILF